MTTIASPAGTVAGDLLFHTGFGGTTRLAPPAGPYFHGSPDQYEDLLGRDPALAGPNDWRVFTGHPTLGTFRIYHEGGDKTQRWARIVSDEAYPSNKILRFWIGQPNVVIRDIYGDHPKSRVQAELYGNKGLREFYQSVRVRFHPDLARLMQFPSAFGWFTLAEFWNKPFWSIGMTSPCSRAEHRRSPEPAPEVQSGSMRS